MDQELQTCVSMKSSPLTEIDVERKSRMSMSIMLLIPFRAVLVLGCQQSVGPPTPHWISSYSYNSPHMFSIGFKKISNRLPVWQVALASIVSSSHIHPTEIDGTQNQDVNSVGYVDLCAAIYAEICEEYGFVPRNSITVSIGPESSERSNAKESSTEYVKTHPLAGYASSLHVNMSRLYKEPHRYYRFETSENVHEKSSRSIGKIKAFIPRIVRKLSASNKYLSSSREPIATSTDKSNIMASSTYNLTNGNLGESAIGYENLESINKITEAYLLRDDVQTRISECAQTLVERRRHREQLDPTRLVRE